MQIICVFFNLRRLFDAYYLCLYLFASFSRRKNLRQKIDAILNLRRFFDALFWFLINSDFLCCVEKKRRNIYFASKIRRNSCVAPFFGDFFWTFSTQIFDAIGKKSA